MGKVLVIPVDASVHSVHTIDNPTCGKLSCPCMHPPRLIERRLGTDPKFAGYDTAENAVVLAALGKLAMRLSLREAYALQKFLGEVLPDPGDLIA